MTICQGERAPTIVQRQLYESTRLQVTRYVRVMIPSADVEDVVAEVYVIMIRWWEVGAVPDLAWLIATAKNLCRNHNRLGRIRLNQTLIVDENLPSQNFDDS